MIGGFQKLTVQFEKAAIGTVQPTKPDKIAQFRQLTVQFKTFVIDAILFQLPE